MEMKKIRNIIILTCLFEFISLLGYGQAATKCNQDLFTDTLLDKLTGQWMATGNVGGDDILYKFSIEWVLNHQFLEMTFSDTAANHEYTAKVLIGFNCKNDKYVVHWIDNFGGAFSETLGYGEKKVQSLEISFDYPQGKLINTFSYDRENDQWTSHSVTKAENETWATFGQIMLKREN